MDELLSREEFRQRVLERDRYQCIICREPAQDAHHIIERRLFADGGHYLENGASLCARHHIEAEQTLLSCEEIRTAANIRRTVLPPHLYGDLRYDKWGNIILAGGSRLRGELFHDESVQKVIAPVLPLFVKYVKYSRTYHLPWSPGLAEDDRVLDTVGMFRSRRVVMTEKMDGENTTLYRDHIHARSVDSESHPSQDWVRNLHGRIAYQIPEGWRVCGENVFARHSIAYHHLKSYFLVFSIWDDRNICQSWDDTVLYAKALELETVPVIYDGVWDEQLVRNWYKPEFHDKVEGYVVRVADAFPYGAFRTSVAKYVRAQHVKTPHNWKRQSVVKNELL